MTPPADSDSDSDSEDELARPAVNENTPLLPRPPVKSTLKITALLALGTVCLSLAGFLLAESSAGLAAVLGVSDTVVGMTLLSFATTLPEKVSGSSSLPRLISGSWLRSMPAREARLVCS
jgi:hypothetical protein